MHKFLDRESAPLAAETWEALDRAMLGVAKNVLAGRRLLQVEGPFGLGLKAVPLRDVEVQPGVMTSLLLPLSFLHIGFTLGRRDIAAFERDGFPLTLGPLVEGATDLARHEDELLFNGGPGIPGLMSLDGVNTSSLSAWDELGTAAQDVIAAVTALDSAGFHGPYALALAPPRFNLLYRRSLEGNISELEHIRTIATEGVFKAPVLEDRGVLIAFGHQFASIVLGQDMSIAFVGPTEDGFEFAIVESLALFVRQPRAICVIDRRGERVGETARRR
jgi:uncharacterized linocin/CFP29 family protein